MPPETSREKDYDPVRVGESLRRREWLGGTGTSVPASCRRVAVDEGELPQGVGYDTIPDGHTIRRATAAAKHGYLCGFVCDGKRTIVSGIVLDVVAGRFHCSELRLLHISSVRHARLTANGWNRAVSLHIVLGI